MLSFFMSFAKKNQRFKQQAAWLLKEKYNNQLTPEAQKDIGRLKKGEPIDYVIGFKEFLGCRIDLSFRPLIPRPETEYWVEKAIADIKQSRWQPVVCLDIFAGSGCIGLAILKNIPRSQVAFADINRQNLLQIETNLKLNQIQTQTYSLIQSDIFQNIKNNYNYILANPPYIAYHNKNKVQKSVLDFEPHQALFAKNNGLDYIKKFLSQARKYLTKNGKIYLEFDNCQKESVKKILAQCHYSDYHFYKDQFNKWRYLTVS